jgi:hypothetical protein
LLSHGCLQVTLAQIKEAEAVVASAQAAATSSQQELDSARLQLREQQEVERAERAGVAPDAHTASEEMTLPGKPLAIKAGKAFLLLKMNLCHAVPGKPACSAEL